jgi:hypothetical protein
MRTLKSFVTRVFPAAMLLALVAAPAFARPLDVEVWTDRGDDAVYQSGEGMRIKVRTTEDAYLLVYEIDTEGNVNLLYPWKRGRAFVAGRHTLRLPEDDSGYDLVVGNETGQGFLVALASDRPFRDLPWFLRPFDPQAASVGYEGGPTDPESAEEGFDDRGRVVGDPYVAMERIRRRVLEQPGELEGVASDYTTYYVHEVVRYPRYLCNDCHRPGYWAWWSGFDPYYARCSVFDFRVNWGWAWGPHLWSAYVPYYYYVVRTDCPPRYSAWATNRNRFSSWDGWGRWNDLWGGQLRRFKPAPAPANYSPPPARGTVWRKGATPPGFVSPDIRTRTGTPGRGIRDVIVGRNGRSADGQPVWRGRPGSGSPAPQPEGGVRPSREGSGDRPAAPDTRDNRERARPPIWRPSNDRPSQDSPRREPARKEPPKRNDPPSREPSKGDPGYNPPPRQDAPRSSPPPRKSEPPRGKGHKNGGNG